MLELYVGKLTRTVLRRERGSNSPDLADEITKPIIKAFLSWKEKVMANLSNMKPRDRYRTMKVLSKCGFDEKEINLAVYGLYH